jgi:hypothetical protein
MAAGVERNDDGDIDVYWYRFIRKEVVIVYWLFQPNTAT